MLKEQEFDYTFPHIHTRTHAHRNGDVEAKTVEMCEAEDENFLLNIGDVYT